MPDDNTNTLECQIDDWARSEQSRSAATPIEAGFLAAVARSRRARRAAGASYVAVTLALLGAAAWSVNRHSFGPSPAPASPVAVDAHPEGADPALTHPSRSLTPRNATIFALMRANHGYNTETVTLPEPLTMNWALERPLGS